MHGSTHGEHADCVDAWLTPAGRDVGRLLALLDEGISRIWRRTELTLGEVTMSAIAERVMHDATRRHPVLEGVALGPSGLGADELRGHDPPHPLDVVQPMAFFLITELLTVIGSLTAGILTSALHAELAEPPPDATEAPTEVTSEARATPSSAPIERRGGNGHHGSEP